ncbi:MAG: pantetheine-phosphate adenylyltransferase [Sphingomonadales bacterium]|nr:pantetheine-phosphate adenylyltransferase [Sphingomonadales bacterium]
MEKIAIYPGSFDPITNGHIDIAERGLKLFDKIIVAILNNPVKEFLFTVEERVEMLESSFENYPDIEVETFDGLLVDYAAKRKSTAILRGMRAVSDFEYEFQMAGMNASLNPDVETVFLMADAKLQSIASRLVKEIAFYGGDIRSFVTPPMAEEVRVRVVQQSS